MGLSEDQEKLLVLLRKTALQIARTRNEFAEFTGIIGELAACQLFGYDWKPNIGYDAVDKNNRKIQIKTRRSWTTERVNRQGTIPRFGRKNQYLFDEGILVEIDQNFEIAEVWKWGG